MNLSAAIKATVRQWLPDLFHAVRRWPWLGTLITLRARFRDDRLGVTASSLTFTTLIALVPLFTVMLAVFSAFPIFGMFEDSLQKYFLQSLVPQGIAIPVLQALTEFAAKAKGVGSIGLLFLLFTALALMLTIDRTLNGIWRVRSPRPIAQRVLIYWAAASLGPLALGVSLSLTSYAVSVSQGIVGVMPGSAVLVLRLLEFGMLLLVFAGLFHYVPNTHVQWRHAFMGAAFSAAGFELAKRLLSLYLQVVPSYRMIYGALATVPIFLVWLYLAWVIVLLGAVIAAYAPSLQLHVKRWPDVPGSRLQLALLVLRLLAGARTGGERGVRSTELAAQLHVDPIQLEPIVDMLMAFDWVGRLDESRDPRFVLFADPVRTPAQPLLADGCSLRPSPASRGLWRRAGFETMTLNDALLERHPEVQSAGQGIAGV